MSKRLPQIPPSYGEGGPPQSQVAPGDTGRELLHAVKNMQQGVTLLKAVVEKQKVRQRQLVVTIVVAALAMVAALGYTRYLGVQQSQQRLGIGHYACTTDNARGETEIEILSASLAANKGNPQAVAFFGPRIARLRKLQKDCDVLYPRKGEKGWPTFWSLKS